MINYLKLGRYEYYNSSQNSDKFWSVKFIKENSYEVMYGKNGQAPLQTLEINETVALKRIKEKLAKGYSHVDSNVDDFHKKHWINQTKKHYDEILPEKVEPVITKKIKI